MTQKRYSPLMPLLAACLIPGASQAAFERDYVSMMGSSSVVPYVNLVAERAFRPGKLHPPLIQAAGTGGALALFCDGMGPESPDVAIASREIKPREKALCEKNGVQHVLELKIGYDALVLAQSKKMDPWQLTAKEARLSFAKWVVNSDGQMVPNPNKTWKQVNPGLPDTPIELLGPPTTSSTHDAFVDLISELQCKGPPWVPAGAAGQMSPELLHKCRSVREDRVYQEGNENDEAHVGLIANSPTAKVGIFGYRMMIEHAERLRPIPIDGVAPSYENIASQAYAGARPLYLYIKTDRIEHTPGMKAFLSELSSEAAWGDQGYLKAAGLVAMPGTERSSTLARLADLGVTPSAARAASAPTKKAGPQKAKAARKPKGKK